MTDAVFEARGLSADWLNGWLAAIGATVVVPGLRLSWSDDAVPYGRFDVPGAMELPEAIATGLPTAEQLEASAIAKDLPGCGEFPRHVTLDAFATRAEVERELHSSILAASVTDLRHDANLSNLDHGAFDVPAPRGETLWTRTLSCAKALPAEERPSLVRRTLLGPGRRVQLNGLGFDARRLPVGVHGSGELSKVHADPVVELLCFCALSLFPTRGNGRQVRQRGWTDASSRPGSFRWFAWRPFLDRWAIDALLDHPGGPGADIEARYAVVPYRPSGAADNTRAYFGAREP